MIEEDIEELKEKVKILERIVLKLPPCSGTGKDPGFSKTEKYRNATGCPRCGRWVPVVKDEAGTETVKEHWND